MSGKTKKNKEPKAKLPKDDEVPLEATEDLLVEDIVTTEETPKEKPKQGDAPKKKSSKRSFKIPAIDPIILASFTVFLVASLIVIGVTIYDSNAGESDDPAAEYGDKVDVNYTGSYFCYYDENGALIFDTSMSEVGDSDDYKKSYEYNEKSDYSPLSLTIGNGQYLNEFESAIIGLKPGETTTVCIEDGYGSLTDGVNKFTVAQTGKTVDKVQTITADKYKVMFKTLYDKEGIPSKGASFTNVDSLYGWKANVYGNADGTVTVSYLAEAGQTYTINGISTVVSTVDDKIHFDYQVSAFDYNTNIINVAIDNESVYVIGSDGTNMTYKTTDEKTGINLYFVIEFVGYTES